MLARAELKKATQQAPKLPTAEGWSAETEAVTTPDIDAGA
jgi:hypothetical protein